MPAILRVFVCLLRPDDNAAHILRILRHTAAKNDTDARVLLLCALPDAIGRQMPEDTPLIRALQSGVMSLNARSGARFELLILSRSWSASARAYIGCENAVSLCRIARDLLTGSKPDAAFAAATISPAAVRDLADGCAAVLFSDLALSCTPDTPTRMFDALRAAGGVCIRAHVLCRREYPQSVFARLCSAGFSLMPPGVPAPDDRPLLVCTDALTEAFSSDMPPATAAADCCFVRRDPPSLSALLDRLHRDCLFRPELFFLLPCAQVFMLFLSALTGLPALAAAAILFPEYHALRRPVRMPGALARLALLPASAGVVFDALLMRLTAGSCLRLRVPFAFLSPAGSVLSGLLLFAAAFRGAHALSVLLPVSALWIAAPYIRPALAGPSIARIPLAPEELSLIHTHAQDAYFSVCSGDASPASAPFCMLCEAAGCMLRLTEPDEAARRMQALLAQCQSGASPAPSAAEQAAMLVCAQYLREHMRDCDAALRPLPAAIESSVLSSPLPQENSRLSAFLRAARIGDSSAFLPSGDPQVQTTALDALFLPLAPARDMPPHPATLPLTHPHAFVRHLRSGLTGQKQEEAADTPGRFLAAAAAALDHPFYALFLRSPVTAPYSALLAV